MAHHIDVLIYFVCKLSLNYRSFEVFSAEPSIMGKVSLADIIRIQTAGTDRQGCERLLKATEGLC